MSLCPDCFDLDVNGDCLANSRHAFRRLREHQIEVAPLQQVCRYRPPGLLRIRRRQQFHMQCDRFGYAMHGQIADNIAGLRTSLFNASAFEHDVGIFLDGEKLRAAQMIIAFHDSGIDTANNDSGGD